jgi:hypothetical protein
VGSGAAIEDIVAVVYGKTLGRVLNALWRPCAQRPRD